MVKSIIKDVKLAKAGRQNIDWAQKDMPVVMAIRKRFEAEKPFKGIRIAACLHVTKETAVLAETLAAGGADVALCASNPLSTQDDVAAALAENGLKTYAVRGIDNKGYYECLTAALDLKPHITIDDGADLVNLIHTKKTELIKGVLGGQEETTTGVIRLRAMAADGELKYPMIAINNAKTKSWFDNFYG
ncbi:adenosylhomocysteinase, partial [Candidatus Micrarchaeota archaeon]|nr:adenosylhomocysteinase [Candidatus Micrarchaeota archaeon]